MKQLPKQFVFVLAAVIVCACGFASAATIQTADEKPLSGAIVGWEDGKLLLKPKGSGPVVKLALADVTEITLDESDRRTPAAKATGKPRSGPLWHVDLGTADHVTASVADWTEASATLALDAPAGATLSVPLDQIRAIWSTTASRVEKAKNLKLSAAAEDIAFVEKDDAVHPVTGLATGLDGEFLTFKFEGQPRKIKLDRLAGLLLAQRELATEKSLYGAFTLTNGDVLSGRIVALEKGAFRITPLASAGSASSPAELNLPLAAIAKIQTRNGRLTWVGDLQPSKVEQVPYLDRLMPYRVNQSLSGGPLTLSDGPLTHGIAVHSRCVLTYDIGGNYDRFHGKVGFQQPEGKAGHAAVRVVGDGKTLWEAADLKGEDKPKPLDLDVTGIKSLTLEVDFGKYPDVGGRVIWGDVRLLKGKAN